VLFGRAVHAVARRSDCDDVLFTTGSEAFVVHLTWIGKMETDPQWPYTVGYSGWEAFRVAWEAPDAE